MLHTINHHTQHHRNHGKRNVQNAKKMHYSIIPHWPAPQITIFMTTNANTELLPHKQQFGSQSVGSQDGKREKKNHCKV
jgi:hypothetical protein